MRRTLSLFCILLASIVGPVVGSLAKVPKTKADPRLKHAFRRPETDGYSCTCKARPRKSVFSMDIFSPPRLKTR